MSSTTETTILNTWMDRVWNQLDESAIDELLAPEAVSHGLAEAPLRGPADWHMFIKRFSSVFSDIKIEIQDQIWSGDRLAARFTANMVHRSTNKSVAVQGTCFSRVRNGQIVEAWNLVDFVPMLIALGVVSQDTVAQLLAPQ